MRLDYSKIIKNKDIKRKHILKKFVDKVLCIILMFFLTFIYYENIKKSV